MSSCQDGKLNPPLVRPTPPSFGPGFVSEYPSCEDSTACPSPVQPTQTKAVVSPADESQRRQYEEWLGETQRLLQMQQRLLEEQIAAHRKSKKSLSAKQRTAKKAGRPFADEDAAQLRHITEQQGTVQKQLEQVHDHTWGRRSSFSLVIHISMSPTGRTSRVYRRSGTAAESFLMDRSL